MKKKIAIKLSDKLIEVINFWLKCFSDEFSLDEYQKEKLHYEILYISVFYTEYCWYHLKDNTFKDSFIYATLEDIFALTVLKSFAILNKINSIEEVNENTLQEGEEHLNIFKSRRKEYNVDITDDYEFASHHLYLTVNLSRAMDLELFSAESKKVDPIAISLTDELEFDMAEYLYEEIRPLKQ